MNSQATRLNTMEVQTSLFLGVKVKPGPIERIKLENFSLDNTVENLKIEAEKKINVPAASLDLIHHGKLLKESTTLQDCGVKNGEMVHVVKKKDNPPPTPLETFTDADLRELNSSLRMLGCTPNAPGWTRAMQLLNEEPVLEGIIAQAPTLGEDCVALSILHEVELLAALGATVQTMRRGANTHPELPVALRQLTSLVQARTFLSNEHVPTSGFAYSLEALSEDEDAEEEETEETERGPITQEQLAAALQQAATEAVSASASRSNSSQESLLRLFRGPAGESSRTTPSSGEEQRGGSATPVITAEVFSEAIAAAMSSATARRRPVSSPMEQSTDASSSQSPLPRDEDYSAQLNHMHEMGLLDDALNVRALLICAGDVNAAINLVFSGAIGDD